MIRISLLCLCALIHSGCASNSPTAGPAAPTPVVYPDYDPDPGFDYQKSLEADDAFALAKNDPRAPTNREYLYAARSTNSEVMNFWIERELLDPKVHFNEATGLSALHKKVGYWNVRRVEKLLKMGFDPNKRTKDTGYLESQQTSLQILVGKFGQHFGRTYWKGDQAKIEFEATNFLTVLEMLVEHGASLDMQYSGGATVMFHVERFSDNFGEQGQKIYNWCVAKGGLKLEDRFLKLDIYLWAAIEAGDVDGARQALENGASTWDYHPLESFPPLRAAVRGGRLEMVRLLLEYPANLESLNGGDYYVDSGLLDETEDLEIIALLEENGVNETHTLVAARTKSKRERDAEYARDKQKAEDAAWRVEWWREKNRQMRAQQQATWAASDRAERTIEEARQANIDRLNGYIDAVNKGMGVKKYDRYDSYGNLQTYRVVD